jgi:hypothetical protein
MNSQRAFLAMQCGEEEVRGLINAKQKVHPLWNFGDGAQVGHYLCWFVRCTFIVAVIVAGAVVILVDIEETLCK